MMMSTTQQDAFFKARFDNVKFLFESAEDDTAFELPCYDLLMNPSLPLSMRVTCCVSDYGIEAVTLAEYIVYDGRGR